MRAARALHVTAPLVVAGALLSGCGGESAPTPARATVTVTATPADASLSLRRVCDDFQWQPNPPSSDALRSWSGTYDDLSVVVLYADPTARRAVEPLRRAADRAVVRQAAPDDERAYEEYRSAYDAFVQQCRAVGSTALS